jgi:hypothetical protein
VAAARYHRQHGAENHQLRDTLGRQADGSPYVLRAGKSGYRFAAPVETVAVPVDIEPDMPPEVVDAAMQPYAAFLDGRATLETLDPRAIARAADVFAAAIAAEPRAASGHVGLATAQLLTFETTRAQAAPNRAALAAAEHHARLACRYDPTSANAWSTLALVLYRTATLRDAVAAARKAIDLEPSEWRHHLRLAFVGAGTDRLRAAERVLKLQPDLALAHWLMATVTSRAACSISRAIMCGRGARGRTVTHRNFVRSASTCCTA